MLARAVVFDLGDILYDASVWRKWLREELERFGVSIRFEELVRRWEEQLTDVYEGKAAYWSRFDLLLESLGMSLDDIEKLRHRAKKKAAEVQVERVPFPGVEDTLGDLKRHGVALAVLSDNEGGESAVRDILRELKIERFFDAVLTSADIGFVKPKREAYLAASKALKTSLGDCAFVGHDLDELEGARSAGMRVVSFNCPAEFPSDVHIKSFRELTHALADSNREALDE